MVGNPPHTSLNDHERLRLSHDRSGRSVCGSFFFRHFHIAESCRPKACQGKNSFARSAPQHPQCTAGGNRADGGANVRSGCANDGSRRAQRPLADFAEPPQSKLRVFLRRKQRSLSCPLSENRRPIPTEVPRGHFWSHLLVEKGGKTMSLRRTCRPEACMIALRKARKKRRQHWNSDCRQPVLPSRKRDVPRWDTPLFQQAL